MKDNARAELEAILDRAVKWCKDNEKEHLSMSVTQGRWVAHIIPKDTDGEILRILKKMEENTNDAI